MGCRQKWQRVGHLFGIMHGVIMISKIIFKANFITYVICLLLFAVGKIYNALHPNPGEWWTLYFPLTLLLAYIIYLLPPIVLGMVLWNIRIKVPHLRIRVFIIILLAWGWYYLIQERSEFSYFILISRLGLPAVCLGMLAWSVWGYPASWRIKCVETEGGE